MSFLLASRGRTLLVHLGYDSTNNKLKKKSLMQNSRVHLCDFPGMLLQQLLPLSAVKYRAHEMCIICPFLCCQKQHGLKVIFKNFFI